MSDKAPREWRRRGGSAEKRGLAHDELTRLAALGIQPAHLAGRLRLVLIIGCYHDFRFTREILLTGSARDQIDQAITALEQLGAHCDCEVLQAVHQPPLGVLWHNPPGGARAARK